MALTAADPRPDVDWGNGRDGGRIAVSRNLVNGVVGPPKTESSIRDVDVPQGLLDDLNIHRALYPPMGTGFVFRDVEGAPLDPNVWHKRTLSAILRRAGFRKVPRMGLHLLRHTYVSLLIAGGEVPRYIQKQAGHSTVSMTMDTYGHLCDEMSVAAMARLNEIVVVVGKANKSSTDHEEIRQTRGDEAPEEGHLRADVSSHQQRRNGSTRE